MLSIQTNVNSLVAQQNLNTNSIFQSKTIQQLTSGYRINSSGDDAAGLAVANKFRSSVAELTQGVANANDGVASLQIMDGGMNNISQMLDRLKTLAMQSASGSFTGGTTGRAQLNSEFQSDIIEINRQAESIGLNQSGAFAKNLAVYLGAGSGSATASNSVVNVDLSKATVDSQSLGLQGVQATQATAGAYDLGAVATSVQKIVTDNGGPGYTYMTFTGPGFGDSNGIKIAVNMTGVGDVNGLVSAVNSAIQQAGQLPTAAAAKFEAANITATIFTNASNQQQLAFNSSSTAFTVKGNDTMSNALLGNFNNVATNAAGSSFGLSGVVTATGAFTTAVSLSANCTLTISGGGMASSIVLNLTAAGTTMADQVIAMQGLLVGTGFTVSGASGRLQFNQTTPTGDGFTVKLTDSNALCLAGDKVILGLSAAGERVSSASEYQQLYSGGANQAAALGSSTPVGMSWADQTVSNTQTVTITANDATGAAHPLAVTLSTGATQSGTGSSIDAAIDAINTQLQASNDSTLQQVVAVKSQASGTQTIQFVSTLSSFTVSVGANSVASMGLNGTQVSTGSTFHSAKSGTGGTADISTLGNAQTAVAAITAAVGLLGSAQANVGKGQNQLSFAMSLAESQITNLSTAQSYIRDANVAQQAANLTKAQVLQQASIAAMAQANSAPQAVLTLLRG